MIPVVKGGSLSYDQMFPTTHCALHTYLALNIGMLNLKQLHIMSGYSQLARQNVNMNLQKRLIFYVDIQPQPDQQRNEVPKLYGVTYVPTLKITQQHTKRGDYGLYDGLGVRAGDQVSKSKHRTKHTWKPNVQKTALWSEVLSQSLQLRVSTGALKMIDRLGGLDRHVL
ncbi:hypothetical protein H4Q26_015821 [Puccinia striiformis f. sp. tritici PST-130]|nr:hypothetical protein H4Q26_015821 [Puccinia striiformis f. sp. tritici PST-130]